MDNFALSSLIPSMNTSLSRIVCCKSQNENLSGARSAGRSRVPEKEDGASRTLFAQRRAGTPCPVASFAEAIGRPDTGGRVQDLAIERLTVAQAAARLGVSQDAVRKRIKRGTIEYEQDQDGRLHVYLDPLEVYETRQDRAADEPTERLAWAQHQEIEFLRRELETRTEEIRRRDSIMAALTQRIPELEGPSQPPTTEDAGAEDNERREENSAGSGGIRRRARRRPGWRRAALLAGLSLGIVVLWFIAVMVGLTLLQP
jgi:excisionase family DNA binding protein